MLTGAAAGAAEAAFSLCAEQGLGSVPQTLHVPPRRELLPPSLVPRILLKVLPAPLTAAAEAVVDPFPSPPPRLVAHQPYTPTFPGREVQGTRGEDG